MAALDAEPAPADSGGMDPWWQRWLVPDRPGLRPFLLAAFALVLPLPAVFLGAEWVLYAMAAGVVIGCGLGLGWALLYLPTWFARAPLAAAAVLLTCAGSVLHVVVMPRWDLVLRLRHAKQELERYRLAREAGVAGEAPTYLRGGGETARFASALVAGGRAVAWTPLPLRRWTPRGWVDDCWLVLRAGNEVETLWRGAELESALKRAGAP